MFYFSDVNLFVCFAVKGRSDFVCFKFRDQSLSFFPSFLTSYSVILYFSYLFFLLLHHSQWMISFYSFVFKDFIFGPTNSKFCSSCPCSTFPRRMSFTPQPEPIYPPLFLQLLVKWTDPGHSVYIAMILCEDYFKT